MATDPRTGREYVTPLAQECHERYLRNQEQRIAEWRALPIEERIAIHAKRMNRTYTRTRAGDAHEHLYELEPLT